MAENLFWTFIWSDRNTISNIMSFHGIIMGFWDLEIEKRLKTAQNGYFGQVKVDAFSNGSADFIEFWCEY